MTKLSFVIVGHVDHGKSSLIGRLLYDTNSIPSDKIEELRKASQNTVNPLEYAFLLDHLREEREQGVTIETTQTFFQYNNKKYVIIDSPGHVEFVKNMITGASQADLAIVIVDANEGIQEQTVRHSFVLSLLGIQQVFVVINKMDLVQYSEEVFGDIVNDMKKLLESLHITASSFIPTCVFTGDNILKENKNMAWYHGPTVMEALESSQSEQVREENPAVFTVQDVYKITDKRIAVGRLEQGAVQKGDTIVIMPTGLKTCIASLEKFNEVCLNCNAGDCFGIATTDSVYIERGYTICHMDAELMQTDNFKASVFWMDESPLCVGERVLLRCATQEAYATVVGINSKINTKTMLQSNEDENQLNTLQAGEIQFKLSKNLILSLFRDIPEQGRFVLMRNDICAGGIITSI